MMYPHHQQTIQRLTEHFRTDPNFVALIIGGSIVKGWALENSDVDFVLVATDEEYARRTASRQYGYFSRDFSDYPDGYVDGKIIDLNFLREVADHGSEPARAAFVNAYATFSRSPEVETLLPRIAVYPEAEREMRMRAFYNEVLLLNWFVTEAQKRGNRYLLMRSVADLVLFGGRFILAHNRILYPYHKWFMRVLEDAPVKPANFMELTHALLAEPDVHTARAFTDAIIEFGGWGENLGEAGVHFMEEREWNWRGQKPPIHDW
jgi:predicted nucleotidyltransferase